MSQQFPLLFSPLKVGNVTLRNRIVNTSHVTGFQRDHLPTEQYVHYYVEMAKGGVAMMIMEGTSPHESGVWSLWNVDDRITPWYQRITKAVHDYGAKMLVQLNHAGAKGSERGTVRDTMLPLIGPSAVPMPSPDKSSIIPHELEEGEIEELVESYGEAARRCKEGGMDGVEIMMGYGNLIPQFLSPKSNLRTDKYGGNLENRLRFPIEILQRIRQKVGSDFLLGVRMSDDFLAYSLSLEDMKVIAPHLEATGTIDYINTGAGSTWEWKSLTAAMPPSYYGPGNFVYLATAVKEVVTLPVIGGGWVNEPALAEKMLDEGKLDLIAMVRELIADPHLPNKAREGRTEDIRPCIACNQSCLGHLWYDLPIGCIYNPVVGREQEWSEMKQAEIRKRVVVVGGGPAGLEAARVAAERGHKVVLYEKHNRLGGQVEIATKAPQRDNFGEITRYYERQIKKLDVEVRLGIEATAEIVLGDSPEAVVIATGSTPYTPDIPGVEGRNVVSVWDVLEAGVDVGERVVLFDTQGLPQGCCTAEFLADSGKKVEIITGMEYVGKEIERLVWRMLYERLLKKGVVMSPHTWIREISEDSVVVYNTISGEERVIEGVDTVVLATGAAADDELYRALKGNVKELYAVGDCVAPRDVEAAVYEGHKVARAL